MNQPVSLNRRFISSRGTPLVSGKNAQKKMALVTLQMTNRRKYRQPCDAMAGLCQYEYDENLLNRILTRICDLSYHRVEGKTDKAANGNPMSTGFGIKYLRGNDPRE
jgi:hypothetical protein